MQTRAHISFSATIALSISLVAACGCLGIQEAPKRCQPFFCPPPPHISLQCSVESIWRVSKGAVREFASPAQERRAPHPSCHRPAAWLFLERAHPCPSTVGQELALGTRCGLFTCPPTPPVITSPSVLVWGLCIIGFPPRAQGWEAGDRSESRMACLR